MHLNLFVFIWRRKLSVLLIAFSFILIGLWTWAYLDSNSSSNSIRIFYNFSNADNANNKHAYMLQKLIAQANRLLRSEQQQQQQQQNQQNKFAAPHGPREDKLIVSIKATQKRPKSHKLSPLENEQQLLFEEERVRILENQQRIRNAHMDELNSMAMDYERVLSSSERQSQYEHELQRMGVPVVSGIGPEGARAPQQRLVHFDLKGAPPKLSFLKSLLPMLKQLGATGLLIEYEDMFPFSGALQVISAKNAYKAEELKEFLESAVLHGFSVMPLVQTFGHMEYVLKLTEFTHLREVSESPQSICPSQKNTSALIEEMLKQIIEFHSHLNVANGNQSHEAANFSHIHIGCDEVYRAAECNECRKHTRHEIFLSHVITTASFVRNRWPQLSVVIWDDMLRAMSLSQMQASNIGKYVEPMIWVYISDIYRFIPPHLWDMYAKVFSTAWAASAFKGAFGESLMIPPLQRHLENNVHWLAVIAKEGTRFSKGFRGLALTGWQRYDHFAVLCELLPTGVPSLIVCLSTAAKGYFSTNSKENDILRVLHCAFQPDSRRSGHPWLELQPHSHYSQLFSTCTYPGSMVYKFMLQLYEKLSQCQLYLQQASDKSAWLSDYNVRHNFSAPLRVRDLTAQTPAHINELTAMARAAHEVMADIYDKHTIVEFIEQQIYPVILSLRTQLMHAEQLLQQRTWPQRPLPYARELETFNLVPVVEDRNGLKSDSNEENQQD